jgi:hypothetical protein
MLENLLIVMLCFSILVPLVPSAPSTERRESKHLVVAVDKKNSQETNLSIAWIGTLIGLVNEHQQLQPRLVLM